MDICLTEKDFRDSFWDELWEQLEIDNKIKGHLVLLFERDFNITDETEDLLLSNLLAFKRRK